MKVIDMHSDTITTAIRNNYDFLNEEKLHLNLEKMAKGDYGMQCFATFIYLKEVMKSPYEDCNYYMDEFDKVLEKYSDKISKITTPTELKANLANDKMSALLTIEEGGVLEGSLEKMKHFYDRGVRMLTLTWNFENEIGYPNNVYNKENPLNTETGLKPFGFELVKYMNDLGVIVDVSHGSDKLFEDVINTATKPIVASHSSSRAVHFAPRNLTDEMIVKLAKNGGMTGINYCPDFISANTKEDQMDMVVEHIKHIVDVGGIDVCGFGSDFDGITTPVGMSDATKMIDLYEKLKDNHFTNEQLEKIFYKNFLRVFEANCKG